LRNTAILAGLTLALLSACQQLFTTSAVTFLAREPATITTLTADSAASFAASLAANPDPALAQSAMAALAALVAANPKDDAILRDAAAVAAVATGLDLALTQAITSVDTTALLAGGSLSAAEIANMASLIDTASVSSNSTEIFTALAGADPAALKASGVGAQTLVIAATALALDDMKKKLAGTGNTVADVLSGSATYTPSAGLSATLTQLGNGAQAIDPGNALLSTLQGFLKF
jgi:hypothetical protein